MDKSAESVHEWARAYLSAWNLGVGSLGSPRGATAIDTVQPSTSPCPDSGKPHISLGAVSYGGRERWPRKY